MNECDDDIGDELQRRDDADYAPRWQLPVAFTVGVLMGVLIARFWG